MSGKILSEKTPFQGVYCAQITEERLVTTRGLAKIGTEDDEEFQELADRIRRQKELTGNEAEAKIKMRGEFWDFMERWTHESLYQLRKEKHRRIAEQYRQMLEAASESIERKIRVMETVQAIYYQKTLFAFYLPGAEAGGNLLRGVGAVDENTHVGRRFKMTAPRGCPFRKLLKFTYLT